MTIVSVYASCRKIQMLQEKFPKFTELKVCGNHVTVTFSVAFTLTGDSKCQTTLPTDIFAGLSGEADRNDSEVCNR